jgi:RNA dependent RNA polymerase
MCPNVSTKPDTLSNDDWDYLMRSPFGSIIFATPKVGIMPIPDINANGDLDGDLFFICWNDEILQSLNAVPREETITE